MKKIVVITGANSGIGKAAAFKFAEKGYRVIMACRNLKISEPVRKEIVERTKNGNVELLQLDISSKGSIQAFCEEFRKNHAVLDILIHNAGHFNHGEKKFQKSIDGIELTSATNLFGPVLMTSLLVELLAKSENARVLYACSTNIKHFFDERREIDFEAMGGREIPGKVYDSYKLYGDTKIGLLMATEAMGEEYKEYGISVNAIMIPATKMSKETVAKFKSYWKIIAAIQNLFIPKAEIIGDAYFLICTSALYLNVTGKLINHHGEVVKVATDSISFVKIITGSQYYPPYAKKADAVTKVWKLCNDYVKAP